ncbi:MAG TPA: hypothetical protein VFF73_03130 [Planctomycetota bacterium]|nr:hypothetical protein [Planctomycetota bacterium]
MEPTSDAILILEPSVVRRAVALIRADAALGRGTCSSWEEVTPTDYEAEERVRMLIEQGVIRLPGAPTPRAILAALRAAESGFWGSDAS